jgi:NAD(P) transhydrogenase subunit alpha
MSNEPTPPEDAPPAGAGPSAPSVGLPAERPNPETPLAGPAEPGGPERRVALLPEHLEALRGLGAGRILVQRGAGLAAGAPDAAYAAAGAELVDRSAALAADLVLGLGRPDDLPAGSVFAGGVNPLGDPEGARALAATGCTVFSLDVIPRTTRAQAMDILSSQATVAGYRAVLVAASRLPRFFPLLMTAAGSIKPAKVLVLGAGVAGLQAIATAKRLGAVVEASDVRQAAREEVLSLGARFVDVEGAVEDAAAGGYAVQQSEDFLRRQQEEVQRRAAEADVVLCTAQIPGRRAPLLLTAETVGRMRPGSVVVDLAASTGGNCAVTRNGEATDHGGVTVIGDSNLAAGLPADASRMYGKNLLHFLPLILRDGRLDPDWNDDLVAGTCVCRDGAVVHERVLALC